MVRRLVFILKQVGMMLALQLLLKWGGWESKAS